MIVAIALIVIAAVGVGAFFLLSDDDDNGNGDTQDDTASQDGGDGGDDGGDGGDSDPQRQAYVDAIAASADTSSFPGATEEDIQCMAGAMVDVIGVDRLAAEATPEEIESNPDWEMEDDPTSEEAEALYDGMSGCFDFREMIRGQWESDPRFTPEIIDCFDGALSDDLLREWMVGEIMEEDTSAIESEFESTLQSECGHLVE